VSYDLAVWEGDQPRTAAEAFTRYDELYDRYIEREGETPTPAITDFLSALLARWPDITEPDAENSPWSDGPLEINASGPFVYIGLVFSMAEEAVAFAAQQARDRGLVCYDPQQQALLS
jgi:hypothetical protein